ncbi:hypothetical protein [Sansalvadorimonas verongulae]|uniref:hypothetical protein n=1 Tax=Sansalvadorimonas verongulae TaxID=2172824 RepID=UPI0012BC783A|nr:hypothetical protein [Sansalvadorimonas verongulae]MTI13290.1 hypothetical protein [Sansalvadorimonas verongulae]
MTAHTDQAEMLIDELEGLRQLLDKPLSENIPTHKEKPNTAPAGDTIPVLDDQIPTLQPLPADHMTSADRDKPLNEHQISKMVDNVVAEYMPVIEKRLREKLLESLNFDTQGLNI